MRTGQCCHPSVSGLIPAHEVLTTAPRTIADYRRLLMRIEGVRNAWLDPMNDPGRPGNYRQSEVPVYLDQFARTLTYDPVNPGGQANAPVRLSGLYRVQVELDTDDLLGSLNERGLTYRVRRGPLKGVVLAFDAHDPTVDDGTFDVEREVATLNATVTEAAGTFTSAVTLTLAASGPTPPQVNLAASLRVIESRPAPDRARIDVTATDLADLLGDTAADALVPLFWLKQRRRARALDAVRCVLDANRGLCEDFLSVSTVQSWRVGMCADITLSADADREAVQAAVFHAIEQYLAPPARFRTLEEMLQDGHQPDQIFNGPFVDFAFTCRGRRVFTKPGFSTDADLASTELRRTVLASDIINIVVDLPGVEAISNVQLRPYDASGRPLLKSDAWQVAVPAGHQPVFAMEVSKLLFFKAGIPYRANFTEFQRTLEYLRAMERRSLYVPPDQVLRPPTGRWRQLDAYASVQHDFPATYKIGTEGISSAESPERIAKARQLKGYLTFFDQVLADYLSQLANLRNLYSLDRSVDRTWFSAALEGIAPSIGEDFLSEFMTAKTEIASENVRARLSESEESFLDRRHRLLDHMIARFAERFADYAFLSFSLAGDRLGTRADLIEDKITFLEEYPQLSRARGQGANVRAEQTELAWDTENVSGLERRVGRLLGVKNIQRRDLHCDTHFGLLFTVEGTRVAVLGRDNQTLFRSEETFADAASALAAAASAYEAVRDEAAFDIAATQGATTFTLRIVSGHTALTHDTPFDTDMDATRAARSIIDRYDELLEGDDAAVPAPCDDEGMHLIEHILLRPAATGSPLMGVCRDDGCGCGDDDPYSFRVSVVLPYWPRRFRSMAFRAAFERCVREEAPAHVQVKVCWIGQAQMVELDAAWRAFLEARAASVPEPATIRSRTKRLLSIIEALKSVYPAATLHECDADEQETPVRLGSSALGLFRRSGS